MITKPRKIGQHVGSLSLPTDNHKHHHHHHISIPAAAKSSTREKSAADMEPSCEELTARIIWAGHILSYLTRHQSNIRLQGAQQVNEIEEDEEIGDDQDDAATERMASLSGSQESIRFQFLDCIAQLLSPSKGWKNVTATALRERENYVEIDAARNDCFGNTREDWFAGIASDSGVVEEEEYFRKLENYMAAVAQQGKTVQLTTYTAPRQ